MLTPRHERLAAWSARRPDTRTRSDHHPARSRRASGNQRGLRPRAIFLIAFLAHHEKHGKQGEFAQKLTKATKRELELLDTFSFVNFVAFC